MDWITHDLSTFVDVDVLFGGTTPNTTFSGGALVQIDTTKSWKFAIPTIVVSPTEATQVEFTFGTPGYDPVAAFNTYVLNTLLSLDPAVEPTADDFYTVGGNANVAGSNVQVIDPATYVSTLGPGQYAPDSEGAFLQDNFDARVVAAGQHFLAFRNSGSGSTSVVQIRTRGSFPGPTALHRSPPLRQYPRNDGLGASSAPRVYPPPASIQASNRRAGGYL